MELETFILTLSILLEVLGAISVAICLWGGRRHQAGSAHVMLIGCVCGLGSVTMIGAMLKLFCGLIAGVAVVVMGLAVVYLVDHHEEENPLASLGESPLVD